MIRFIWEGIYPHLRDVPRKGKGFGGDTWVRRSLEKTRQLREEAANASPCLAAYNRSLLPVVAAMAFPPGADRIRLVDFGGGIGANYYHVTGSLPPGRGVEYHIVEVPEICDAGREFFAGQDGVHFHEQWPDLGGTVDLLHMGSSIQYVEDWEGVLAAAARLSPRYLLFSDLIAGDIPTYASAQVYYESLIPMWFFNRDEFVAAVARQGYEPAFVSRFLGTFLGQEQELPQENFPDSHKLRRACHMLFVPAKDGI
jgi:putative methyltransferase (TIGR04325 family)